MPMRRPLEAIAGDEPEQAVREGEAAVGVAHVAQRSGQRSELVHDDLGLDLRHRPGHVFSDEGVADDRGSVEIPQQAFLEGFRVMPVTS